ncbi:MAG: isoaspartyl peptidase/L-asparaginase family protein [Desulfitobacteriaceae bacterium]
MAILVIHGSVETSEEPLFLEGLKVAALKGYQKLAKGRLPAVVAAVNELEDNPLFNAGLGSVLNRDGYVEVDGSLMDGDTGKFAAVAAVQNIRYAITVAQKLLQNTKVLFLVGLGATQFARENGIPIDNCITEEQLASWRQACRLQAEGKDFEVSPYTGLPKGTDTVGCVVCDDKGKLAAGSSTGGSFFKLPGRVGDTPMIGGGIFSSEHSAVVCTGRGEAFIQTMTAKFVDDRIKAGCHPQDAAEQAICRMTEITGENGGVIVVDSQERLGMAHNCSSFPVAVLVNGSIVHSLPIKLRCS